MKSAMRDKVDLTPNELEAMSSDDEYIGDSTSVLEDDADVESNDEDEDDWIVVTCDILWELDVFCM